MQDGDVDEEEEEEEYTYGSHHASPLPSVSTEPNSIINSNPRGSRLVISTDTRGKDTTRRDDMQQHQQQQQQLQQHIKQVQQQLHQQLTTAATTVAATAATAATTTSISTRDRTDRRTEDLGQASLQRCGASSEWSPHP
mmetsp:Transcript_61300/g.84189  ORF Transcript_61300/g.84189 Transcript_61300/m.84189 type:complete len:139 (-) Transcript_61300:66-482(-)